MQGFPSPGWQSSPVSQLNLEPDDGAEGDAEIVVRSLIEIDFVAGFESQTDRAEREFCSGAGIQSGVQVSGAESEDRAGDVAIGQQTGAQAKIHEACLHSG